MGDSELNPDSKPVSDSAHTGEDAGETDLPELAETMAELTGAEPPAPPPENEPGKPPETVISFDNVSISFDGRPVLENVSFSVERGQTLCILGRSGVGKSVSLRLLM